MSNSRLIETITLSQAKSIIKSMAHKQSMLLLSAPGVGKSDTVMEAAKEMGLPLTSLLGTQIAPEDVSGVPRIIGERTVFCPPRVLLPEIPAPFCLFLDELPATAPDVQKAFYSLLLERRIGEFELPKGTWVVGAGNRVEDRALVRSMSSALINRVTILNIRVDVKEWMIWASENGVRSDIIAFITFKPEALMRNVPNEPIPFSTPRSWTLLSQALNLAEESGIMSNEIRRALAFGRITAEDAAIYCAMAEERINSIRPLREYFYNPNLLKNTDDSALWFILSYIRNSVKNNQLTDIDGATINNFLMSLPQEHRFALLVDLIQQWGELGASETFSKSLREVTGL